MALNPNSLPTWDWDIDSAILLQRDDGKSNRLTEGKPPAGYRSTESQPPPAAETIGALPDNEAASYPIAVPRFHNTWPSGSLRAAETSSFEHGGGGTGGDHGTWNLGRDNKQRTLQDRLLGLRSYESAKCRANVEEQGTEKENNLAIFTPKQQRRLVLGNEESYHHHHGAQDQKHNTLTLTGTPGESTLHMHLGKRTCYQESAAEGHHHHVADASLSKEVPYKHASYRKLHASASQAPCCQVDDCEADLSFSTKDYHRKHKVCESHSKAKRVVVKGQEQRFCQQCSRFHALSEFDEAKRSCRRRLAGHNERRRKPQPETLSLSTRLTPAFGDWSFSQDESSAVSSWARMGKNEDHLMFDYSSFQASRLDQELHLKNACADFNNSDKFPFLLLQSPKLRRPDGFCPQRGVHDYSHGGHVDDDTNITSSGAEVLSGLEATPVTQLVTRVSDCGRALSLLSPHTIWGHDPSVVSLGLSNWTSSNLDQLVNEHGAGQQQQLSGWQQYMDISSERIALMAPSSYTNSSTLKNFSVSFKSMGPADEYDHPAGSAMSGMNVSSCLENSYVIGGRGHYGTRDMKVTGDLWRTSTSEALSLTLPQGQRLYFQHGSGDGAFGGHSQY